MIKHIYFTIVSMIVQYNTHAWCQISICINTRSLKKGLTFNIKIFHMRHNHNLTTFVAFVDYLENSIQDVHIDLHRKYLILIDIPINILLWVCEMLVLPSRINYYILEVVGFRLHDFPYILDKSLLGGECFGLERTDIGNRML